MCQSDVPTHRASANDTIFAGCLLMPMVVAVGNEWSHTIRCVGAAL